MSTTLLVIIVLLVLAFGWGGYGTYGGRSRGGSRRHPSVTWGPVGAVLVLLILLYVLGLL